MRPIHMWGLTGRRPLIHPSAGDPQPG